MWWSGSVLQSHEVFAELSGGQEKPPSPLWGDGEPGGRVRAWVDSCWHAFSYFFNKQFTFYFFLDLICDKQQRKGNKYLFCSSKLVVFIAIIAE
jgi:hypothetical protein